MGVVACCSPAKATRGTITREPRKSCTWSPGLASQMIDIDGEQWESIAAGEMIHIPADIFHSTVNTGWEPLKLIAVYSPPGPEAILRAMPECRVLAPGELPEI